MNTIHDPQSTVQAAPAIAAVSGAADTSAADASTLTANQAAGVDRAKAYHAARTVDERLEGRRKAALQIHLDLRADVNLLIGRITRSDDQGDMITLMDTTEWWKTLRTLRRLTKLIVPLTKRKLTEAQKKQEMKRLQKEEAERQKATADKR